MVTEAKMCSKLSAGVTNARYYNQAARNVACIAEVINRAGIAVEALEKVGFFVIDPQSRIDEGKYASQMGRDNIRAIVYQRVSEYEDAEKIAWFENAFLPLLEILRLRSISWEEIISVIKATDSDSGADLADFYARCLEFNLSVKQ
jgi:hypothetical protein